ncbi:MAG: hypothetical protein KDD44_05435, partial [Bdellovibrionales bacterium]|nr:hypothetical protein [Bdellovibrionales bacterium]
MKLLKNSYAKITREQRELYGARFRECGDTPRGVFWNDAVTRDLRYSRLVQHIPWGIGDSPLMLLDVGCGSATLHDYLTQRSLHHRY